MLNLLLCPCTGWHIFLVVSPKSQLSETTPNDHTATSRMHMSKSNHDSTAKHAVNNLTANT